MTPTTTTPASSPFYDGLLDCVHCGFCLDVCPTYTETGNEARSPRGRIYLMRAMEEGKRGLDANAVDSLASCVGCQACETACPSGVKYGQLIAVQRERIGKLHGEPVKWSRIKRLLLWTLTSEWRASLAMAPAALAGRVLGAGRNVIPSLITRFMGGTEAMNLHHPVSPIVHPVPRRTPAVGQKRATVAMLSGCVMNVLYHDVNMATVRVLAANGCEVLVPKGRQCCGALHAHNGELDEARSMAKRTITSFERIDCDAVVVNSAGCGSTMKEYGHLLADEPAWAERAKAFSAKVKDINEFLDELGLVQPLNPVNAVAAYHEACHLGHAQGVRKAPLNLMKQVPGLELVPLEEFDMCCGSAGIYNFLEPAMASRLQSRKVGYILATGAAMVITANPGCLSWINDGLLKQGESLEVLHPIEILDLALGA